MAQHRRILRSLMIGSALVALTACDQPFDFDLRGMGNGLDTSDAALAATADRPQADKRGVISYPNYQVAVAFKGDNIANVAARVGLPADELARYNGIPPETQLRQGEIIALPRRVSEPSTASGGISSGPIQSGGVDITTLAGNAINNAGPDTPVATTPVVREPAGAEPIRHKVERGETAYSIARLYNVSPRSLADWNGLGTDLNVREGQFLLIPVAVAGAKPVVAVTPTPGAGSATPVPPSATTALPTADTTTKPVVTPASPDLADDRTAASGTSKLQMPVNGKIIRSFVKKSNDGIDIAADAGARVVAADAGTVAAITRDTDGVPILVLRHANNMLTVYAGVDGVTVKKGDKVKRGQAIATVRAGNPSFVHFEVRQGFDSVDPMPFLN